VYRCEELMKTFSLALLANRFAQPATLYIFRKILGLLGWQYASANSNCEAFPATEALLIAITTYMIGPLPYIGGKNRLAKQIIDIFPKHKTYVEAFAGGAQVLFHKDPSDVEVLNDTYNEVVNFFRVCQSHHEELRRYLRFSLASRQWFALFQAQDPAHLTDIQRAARFFYLQKNAYAGLVNKQNFSYSVTQPSGFNPDVLPDVLEQAHKRLARVQIESLPYEDVLRRYDRAETLFYLDPPYWERKYYRFNFTQNDFVKLEERLSKLKGKFVLSLDDRPEVRKLFKQFVLKKVDLHYTSQKQAGRRFGELLILNFSR
jgi:DNA adenine methylase